MFTPLDIFLKTRGCQQRKQEVGGKKSALIARVSQVEKVFAQCQGTRREAFHALYKESRTHVRCS